MNTAWENLEKAPAGTVKSRVHGYVSDFKLFLFRVVCVDFGWIAVWD